MLPEYSEDEQQVSMLRPWEDAWPMPMNREHHLIGKHRQDDALQRRSDLEREQPWQTTGRDREVWGRLGETVVNR